MPLAKQDRAGADGLRHRALWQVRQDADAGPARAHPLREFILLAHVWECSQQWHCNMTRMTIVQGGHCGRVS